MTVQEFKMEDLIEFRPEAGEIFLNHNRMVVLNTDAMGTLRKDLINNLGFERAKAFLIRYGWQLGYNDAINFKKKFSSSSDREWLSAGPTLHTLEGISKVKVDTLDFDRNKNYFYLTGQFINSFEAAQHIRYFGLSDIPVCWILLGYAGGYGTAFFGETVIYKETQCKGKGDPCCCFEGKTLSQWGYDEVIRNELPYYEEQKISEEIDLAYKKIQIQHRQLKRLLAVQQQLYELILNREGLPGITKTIAQIINGNVLLFDNKLNPLVVETHYSEKVMKEFIQKLADYFHNSLYDRGDCSQDSVLSPKLLPTTIEVMISAKPCRAAIVPVITGNDVLGIIVAIQESSRDTEDELIMLQSAACIYAMEIMRKKEMLDLEQHFRADFADTLLAKRYTNEESLVEWGMRLGYDISKPNYVLLMEITTPNYQKMNPEEAGIFQKQILQITSAFFKNHCRETLCVEVDGQVVVFLPHTARINDHVRKMTALLSDKITQYFHNATLYVGVGNVAGTINHYHKSYIQAQKALKIVKTFHKKNRVLFYDELGSSKVLIEMQDKDNFSEFITRKLGPLLEYDEKHKSDLINTLECYLATENIPKTAQITALSISGLKYRLNKIKELGYDLQSPQERFDLHLAIKMFKIGS